MMIGCNTVLRIVYLIIEFLQTVVCQISPYFYPLLYVFPFHQISLQLMPAPQFITFSVSFFHGFFLQWCNLKPRFLFTVKWGIILLLEMCLMFYHLLPIRVSWCNKCDDDSTRDTHSTHTHGNFQKKIRKEKWLLLNIDIHFLQSYLIFSSA